MSFDIKRHIYTSVISWCTFSFQQKLYSQNWHIVKHSFVDLDECCLEVDVFVRWEWIEELEIITKDLLFFESRVFNENW